MRKQAEKQGNFAENLLKICALEKTLAAHKPIGYLMVAGCCCEAVA
jgi:hypothetical protein